MIKSLLSLLGLTLLCVGGNSAAVASPLQFTFSFAGSAALGSGTFSADTTAQDGQYLVTGISGTVDGSAITGLLPVGSYPVANPPLNDNLLFYPASGDTTFVDLAGIGFVDATGNNYDVYFSQVYSVIDGADGTAGSAILFDVAPAAVTPEPGSLLLVGTGAFGFAGMVRRRLSC